MVHKRMGMPFQPQYLPLVNYSLWSSLIIDSIDGRWMLTKTQAELFSKFFLAEVNRGHSKLSGPKKWNLTLYLIMRERPRRLLAEALLSSIDKRDESNPTDRYCKHSYLARNQLSDIENDVSQFGIVYFAGKFSVPCLEKFLTDIIIAFITTKNTFEYWFR